MADAGGEEERVVTFLSEKEERRVAAGKVYGDRAAAKKRERKARYRARKEAEAHSGSAALGEDIVQNRSKLTAEEEDRLAAEKVATELGGLAAGYELAYSTGENAVPAAFQGALDAVLEHAAETLGEAGVERIEREAKRKKEDERKLGEGALRGKNRMARRQAKREMMMMDDSYGIGTGGDAGSSEGDDEGDDEGIDATTTTGGGAGSGPGVQKDFGRALDAILGVKSTTMAGEEAAARRAKAEKKEAKEKREHRKLRETILDSAHNAVDDDADDVDGERDNTAVLARERELRKIATRGVVQLFNAIAQHQSKNRVAMAKEKEEEEREKDPLTADVTKGDKKPRGQQNNNSNNSKRDKDAGDTNVAQQRFLDILRGESKEDKKRSVGAIKRSESDDDVDKEDAKESVNGEKRKNGGLSLMPKQTKRSRNTATGGAGAGWSAFKDDFMTGAKLNDWKKGTKDMDDDAE